MLPAHDDLWLADHEGNKYTSELRFTWVDDRRLNTNRAGSYGNFRADNQPIYRRRGERYAGR
jgi:hypothetical protein